jgi:hypothetical protein
MSQQARANEARPDGLPEYRNAQAWYGEDMARRTDWIHELTAEETEELQRAVRVAQASGREAHRLERAQFPLDQLAHRLAGLRREALEGRGFFLLRGVPIGQYSAWESAAAFWGIGLYLGEAVSQNGKGHVLGHVANLGLDYADPEVRGYQTNALLNYHTDSSDLVGLLCLRTPQSGGLSSIASSTTVWNEMVRRRPDLARVLLEPVYYTRWGEIPEGRERHFGMPVFSPWEGRMVVAYVRSAIRKAQLMPEVPRLTPAQEQAMDLLDSVAADPRVRLTMEFRPGDIQILCNHWILHSRTGYVDWPEPERRRHLLRLWLACDDGPSVPPFFTNAYQGATRGGRPDGIRVPGVPFTAPLEPC